MKLLNKTVLSEKIRESLSSVLPVTAIVLILLATFIPVPSAMLLAFLVGAVMIINRRFRQSEQTSSVIIEK